MRERRLRIEQGGKFDLLTRQKAAELREGLASEHLPVVLESAVSAAAFAADSDEPKSREPFMRLLEAA